MRGFDEGTKEYEAIREYVRLIIKLGRGLNPDDMDINSCAVLTKIWEEYTKGFIGCEMVRIKKLEGL